MTDALPAVPSLTTIIGRLALIFPEGVDNRNYCIRESTAKTVLVMFYTGAIAGASRWIRPSQVTEMTDSQIALDSDDDRNAWCEYILSNKKKVRPEGAWYAANSREQIRDENLRQGLIPNGGVVERPNIATTASLPKYALDSDFSKLFDEALTNELLAAALENWQKRHRNIAARARLSLIRKGAAAASGRVIVKLPNGEAISLSPGPSSVITKAVVEEFASRFLKTPALLWVSESANKIVDDNLAAGLGLKIDPAKNLPDIILVDVDANDGVLVVFVEVVHSDGPVNQMRKQSLEALAVEAGFDAQHLTYVSAFSGRDAGPYRNLAPNLAWGTFVWFANEPDCLISLMRDTAKKLAELG